MSIYTHTWISVCVFAFLAAPQFYSVPNQQANGILFHSRFLIFNPTDAAGIEGICLKVSVGKSCLVKDARERRS